MHHPMTNHNAAAFAALSGRSPAKGDLELLANDRNDPPCLGSTLSFGLPVRPGLPTFVALPHVMYNVVKLPGQVAGFLGSAHDPFQVASAIPTPPPSSSASSNSPATSRSAVSTAASRSSAVSPTRSVGARARTPRATSRDIARRPSA